MSTLEQYIEAEFRRYFPDAGNITCFRPSDDPMDEFLCVSVKNKDGTELDRWDFESGSDDSYYRFDNGMGEIITVPLMKEEP
jgi:hypothetical protein